MAVERKRLLMEFYALIHAKEPICSQSLASYVGVSQRTLKNDIVDLRNFASASGCQLRSKKGVGYWLEVIDDTILEPVSEQLEIYFNEMNYIKKEYVSRTNDIIRRIIAEDEYVKLDDLADELYLSRSSIRQDMKEARRVLKTFGLTLEAKRGQGVKIVGKELNRRYCMVELVEQHYYKSLTIFKYSKYKESFEVTDEEAAAIRKIFLDVLRNSTVKITDPFINRSVQYIILMRYRHRHSCFLQFDDQQKNLLRQFEEYTIAAKILKTLCSLEGFVEDENEIYAIELLLLLWLDLYEDDPVEQRYPLFAKQAEALTTRILNRCDQLWGFDFSVSENAHRILIPSLIPILAKIYFGCTELVAMGFHVENNSIRTTPLSICFAHCAAEVIKEQSQIQITENEINFLAVRFYALIDEIQFHIKGRRLLICSRNGMQASQIIRHKLLRRFSPVWFAALEIYDFYEVRKLDPKAYDYVLLNFPSYSYHYEIPFIQIDQIPTSQQMDKIYHDILLDSYCLPQILDSFHFASTCFFDDYEYESKSAFCNLISYKHAKNSKCVQQLKRRLNQLNELIIRDETAIIFISRQWTQQSFFEIYRCAHSGLWGQKKVRYLIVISVDFGQDDQKVRFMEYTGHRLLLDHTILDRMIEQESLNELIEVIKQCL